LARALADVVDIGVEATTAVGLLAVGTIRALPRASRSDSVATATRSHRSVPPTVRRS
jgi:hypothetical protein